MDPAEQVIVVYGPTASGKSAASLALAGEIARRGRRAEIITADAFQVYRGMDIGTAKPAPGERGGVPHHLIDIADPHAPEPFTVDDWLGRAGACVGEVRSRGATPIVVGGTSLYVQAFMFGLFEGPAADPALRAELAGLSPDQLRAELERVDPAAAQRIHPSDTRRTTRAIEVFRLMGTPISTLQTQWEARSPRSDARLVILSWPVEDLNRRINARVRSMMEAGLLNEVRGLLARGPLNRQAGEALGYKQLIAHLNDPRRMPLDEAVERIKIETRRFAKNQRTWIRRMTPFARVLSGGEGAARALEDLAG